MSWKLILFCLWLIWASAVVNHWLYKGGILIFPCHAHSIGVATGLILGFVISYGVSKP